MPHAHAHAHGSAAPETRAVTALSVVVTATLLVLKVIVWLASGSVAILASAADSGLDVAASAATFFAVRYAATPADAEHRFGHGKAEAFASLFQGGLVFASAALVGEEAIQHILKPQPVTREGWGVGVMVISILFTVGIVIAQTRALRRTQSVAVSADRTHYMTDLASNLMALIGIAATALTGLTVLDAIGGLLVALVLLGGAVSVFREASNELMDRELPNDERERIRTLALQDSRVLAVHALRTRQAGPTVHIQMHADLPPNLSLVEAHRAVVAAERRIIDAFPNADVLIHPDPRGEAEPHGSDRLQNQPE